MASKRLFLENEFWILSWNASVQRALKYSATASEADKKTFRDKVIGYCQTHLIPQYHSNISDCDHIENIEKLQAFANTEAGNQLLLRPYNIGIAQKLLNLQLKYLWCAGYMDMPPHCPVDRIILSRTRLKGKMNWTQMESIADYRNAISSIMDKAGPVPIAQWELEAFSRRSNQG